MKIFGQLAKVQDALKVPKTQYNSFGKYNYRSCEDILEAVKPLLKEENLTLLLADRIFEAGSRVYVEATAQLLNADGEKIETHAYAREPENKKGMDESQITGTASSYARKYALNGLLLIDDTKDVDTDSYKMQSDIAKCPKCGQVAKGYTGKSGKSYTGTQVIAKYGMCLECLKNDKNNI